jgi:hypothetical protein
METVTCVVDGAGAGAGAAAAAAAVTAAATARSVALAAAAVTVAESAAVAVLVLTGDYTLNFFADLPLPATIDNSRWGRHHAANNRTVANRCRATPTWPSSTCTTTHQQRQQQQSFNICIINPQIKIRTTNNVPSNVSTTTITATAPGIQTYTASTQRQS